jgi:hypothetical protein
MRKCFYERLNHVQEATHLSTCNAEAGIWMPGIHHRAVLTTTQQLPKKGTEIY